MKRIKLIAVLIAASLGLGLGTISTVQAQKNKTATSAPATMQRSVGNTAATEHSYTSVNALDVVKSPEKYLNKHIKIKAKFDKFSALGLDYKPAYRSAEKYISFLISRDDVTNHIVPLSEMKIFMLRSDAEKYIDLETGDLIEFSGFVFSNALGDPWVEIEKLTVISSKAKDKDKNSTKK